MFPGQNVFLAEFFLWCGLVLAAPVMTVSALFRSRYRRMVAVAALCLWCAIAGGALMGAMWGWMANADQQVQLRRIASLPDGAKAADVTLRPMGSVLFFVELDKLVSLARKLALNSRGMFSEPATHLLIRPGPFNGMGVPMVVFRPRGQDMSLEFLLTLPGRPFQVIVFEAWMRISAWFNHDALAGV